MEKILPLPELNPLEKLSDAEYSKLTVGQRKIANNLNLVMGNLEMLHKSVNELRTGHNSMIKNLVLNTDQVNDVDCEMGQLSGQKVDLQRAVSRAQNDNQALKGELKKRDYEMDERERDKTEELSD